MMLEKYLPDLFFSSLFISAFIYFLWLMRDVDKQLMSKSNDSPRVIDITDDVKIVQTQGLEQGNSNATSDLL